MRQHKTIDQSEVSMHSILYGKGLQAIYCWSQWTDEAYLKR